MMDEKRISRFKHIKHLALSFIVAVALFLTAGQGRVYAASVRGTDVSTPASGNVFVSVRGNFYTLPVQQILDKINRIRYEACQEGIINPDNDRPLTPSDYEPLKWSSALEWIAQTRAAEATVYRAHQRPSGKDCFSVTYAGQKSWGENLAWNYTGIMQGIDQFYSEKQDWIDKNNGRSHGQTGHYTNMIRPKYNYVGMGCFRLPGGGWYTTAQEFSFRTGLDESAIGVSGTYDQVIEVPASEAYRFQPASNTTNKVVNPSSVKITGPKTIDFQGAVQLYATVKPDNAVNKTVTWSIEKGNGTVDENGVVTCIGSGDIKVRATTSNGKKATYTLKGPKAASSVKITGPKTIEYQGTVQLSATVKPDNAIDKTVTWSIDKGNGTVDSETGLVTCIGSGDIKVRATTSNGKKSTYTLKGPKAASSVKITGPKTIEYQGTAQLSATVKPDNAIDKTVTWSIDKGNGTVDPATGLVTCTGAGDIKVRATSSNGKKATYTLKGPKDAASVKITGEKNIVLNGTVQLSATVKPDNAIDKTVTWSIDKGNGTVDPATGLVTCTGAGDIKVRATAVTGKKGTFTIKGPKAATSVSVKKSSYKLAVGESVHPTATVNPKGVIDPNVTWSSSDPAIATVTPEGVITAVAPGKTTILATAHNGKVGKCTITVN